MAGVVRTVSVVFNAFTGNFNKNTLTAGDTMLGFATKAEQAKGLIKAAFQVIKKVADAFADSFERIGKLKAPTAKIGVGAIQDIRKMNKAIKDMGTAWTDIIDKLAIFMAPVITLIADLLTGMLTIILKIGAFIQKFIIEPFQEFLESGILNLLNIIGLLTDEELEMALKIKLTPIPLDDKKPVKTQIINIKSFSDAVEGGSSKAFDILNPDRPGSIAQEQLAANKETAENTAKIVAKLDEEGVRFVEVPL